MIRGRPRRRSAAHRTAPGRAVRCAFAPEGGFGLIEVLIVLVIIAILAGIAVPLYLSQRDKAKEAALTANLRSVRIALGDYLQSDRSRTYRRSDDGGAVAIANAALYVSNALEFGLERGVPGDNGDGYRNPYTLKRSIVNWSSIYKNARYCPPAVFITDTSGCRWASINGNASRSWLRGTIMVVWNTPAGVIETFAMGGDGLRIEGTLRTVSL